jgi:hypothetical protein
MLRSGDLTVQTGNGDHTAASIIVSHAFSWTTTTRLTLVAKNNITVKAPVTVEGTGAATLTYGTGNPDGDLLFEKQGKIDFWDLGSGLVINGSSYALVGDITTLAAEIASNPSGRFALASDYDASADGIYHQPAITTTMEGAFEGLGHRIENLSVVAKAQNSAALFAAIGTSGVVRDVVLENVTAANSA